MSIIGFAGIEKYDLIINLALILRKLDKKVAIYDLSESKAICYTVPYGLEPGAADLKGADVFSDVSTLVDNKTSYDYILIDFGFDVHNEAVALCKELYIVTDFQMQNYKKLLELELGNNQARYLVLRYTDVNKHLQNSIISEFAKLYVTQNNTFRLESFLEDSTRMLSMQHEGVIRFKKIPEDVRFFLMTVLADTVEEPALKGAIKALQRESLIRI